MQDYESVQTGTIRLAFWQYLGRNSRDTLSSQNHHKFTTILSKRKHICDIYFEHQMYRERLPENISNLSDWSF